MNAGDEMTPEQVRVQLARLEAGREALRRRLKWRQDVVFRLHVVRVVPLATDEPAEPPYFELRCSVMGIDMHTFPLGRTMEHVERNVAALLDADSPEVTFELEAPRGWGLGSGPLGMALAAWWRR